MLSKYFKDYDSEQDENYEPTAKQNKDYQQQHTKKKKGPRERQNISAHELYIQMRQEYTQNQKNSQKIKNRKVEADQRLNIANSIMNSQSIRPNKRILFAGRQYIMNQQTGQLQAVQRKTVSDFNMGNDYQLSNDQIQNRNRHIAYQYLNHVMQAIYNRSKKINAIGKSKLDWKGFVKQEGIQDKLQYNRKGGIIQNMQFIRNTN